MGAILKLSFFQFYIKKDLYKQRQAVFSAIKVLYCIYFDIILHNMTN